MCFFPSIYLNLFCFNFNFNVHQIVRIFGSHFDCLMVVGLCFFPFFVFFVMIFTLFYLRYCKILLAVQFVCLSRFPFECFIFKLVCGCVLFFFFSFEILFFTQISFALILILQVHMRIEKFKEWIGGNNQMWYVWLQFWLFYIYLKWVGC